MTLDEPIMYLEGKVDQQRVWVRDSSWKLLPADSQLSCRYSPRSRCTNRAVAALRRSNGEWNYCEKHLYGRRIANGIVEVQVAADSPAAQRGYV